MLGASYAHRVPQSPAPWPRNVRNGRRMLSVPRANRPRAAHGLRCPDGFLWSRGFTRPAARPSKAWVNGWTPWAMGPRNRSAVCVVWPRRRRLVSPRPRAHGCDARRRPPRISGRGGGRHAAALPSGTAWRQLNTRWQRCSFFFFYLMPRDGFAETVEP